MARRLWQSQLSRCIFVRRAVQQQEVGVSYAGGLTGRDARRIAKTLRADLARRDADDLLCEFGGDGKDASAVDPLTGMEYWWGVLAGDAGAEGVWLTVSVGPTETSWPSRGRPRLLRLTWWTRIATKMTVVPR